MHLFSKKMNIAFILVSIISLLNSAMIYNLNKFFIGKMMILIIIIFFAINDINLGLLLTFIYIIILEKYNGLIIEGMEEQRIDTIDTIGELPKERNKPLISINTNINENANTNANTNASENKLDKQKDKLYVLTTDEKYNMGIDIQDIKDSISSKDSNSLPLSKDVFKSGDDIEAFNN